MNAETLRTIPSVERILSSSALAPLTAEFGREQVKEAVVAHLSLLRRSGAAFDEAALLAEVRGRLSTAVGSSLRRVINGTGVLIHTNLGRCPVNPELWREAESLVSGYTNLEFDLDEGGRGKRDEHLASLCATVFGAEAAILTNNNAAATLLLLAATAAGKDVLVSRGELVEIGGAFRVPDVIQQGGARLREVGTTNRTRAADYAEAVTRRTAALLRVHRSNFEIVGFTETPTIAELVEVARAKKRPLLYDEGSGRVVDLRKYGFAGGETIRELLSAGVHVVTCSTDKLLGATQGGLILGRRELVEQCRRHPLMRALRVGKETYAIVAATLRAFATGRHETLVPIYQMLSLTPEALRARAEELVQGTAWSLTQSHSALGGGTTPTETIPSVAIAAPGDPNETQARFLRAGIVGRIVEDRYTVDVRTLQPDDLPVLRAVVTGNR
ncbi:MAG TPA: L-seryl-tRNA(Sec) selenium transferase [Thermoanaerobaculia bacterium]